MKNDKYIKELFEFLEIPTISAQTKHTGDMKAACDYLSKKLSSLGFSAQTMKTHGHPVVYGESLSAGEDKPTILVYGHYDVQSPDPLDEWLSYPFKPEIRSGNIYARGVADDKGQLYTWIAACEEMLGTNKSLPVNVKFLLEGEEEVGSENLNDFVEENTSLIKADVCVISDSHSLNPEQPLITYGLKGISYMEIMVKTLGRDVHSGMYGGNVLNPANVLAQIISKLKDENHKVLIPGFYESVRKLSRRERDKLSKFPFTEKEVAEETGAFAVCGENGFSVAERAGARPTLDVNGIWGGYQGEGQKTIIPGEAGAKISMRIVPNQDSNDIAKKFEDYVQEIKPDGVEVTVKQLSGGEPILMNTDSKYFGAAEEAYEKVFGNKPLYELSGGSIPVTATFKRLMGIDSVLMGYGLPDDGLHSPNEKLSVAMFEKGIKVNLEFLKKLGTIKER